MAGSVKTEAIVLRSIRYGEADRILHLYTPHRGRVGAIAKGVRRAKSRFGGRLEPFFRVRLVLYEGRSDLLTVTSAETVAPHARLRTDAAALDAAALDALQHEVRARYNRSGAGWITATVLGGRPVLRVTVMNPRTTAEHVRRMLDGVAAVGSAIVERLASSV